ncbi:hypothetical protein [Chromobacterium piscinae]|uniref:hypothetical protein n=1 Tax=Chromobacterium piscinae TaxID=686831 RepID=UPI001C8B1C78|nr:hypothetical protein [Chromobacterium piscinae]MBX9298059.1 hypothetical protein [Chromobacterium vaccinii]MBX9348886.1 hypothetical protein [Chromobacterium vaccinii]MBX9355484.1 hypothetical protein [Chromobacterium vaccinii]MCD4506274.1 hypothetical protein [Chromobacterium piscinae]MCD5326617.1 hypothetical protein [Chromobacterium piscinae]
MRYQLLSLLVFVFWLLPWHAARRVARLVASGARAKTNRSYWDHPVENRQP